MFIPFLMVGIVTVAGAIGAVVSRNLVHCALALTVAFAGLAALYLQLDAPFVGFSQVLVYIGAVAILIVFTILLTRGSEPASPRVKSGTWLPGIGVAVAVFGVLGALVLSDRTLPRQTPGQAEASVGQIGNALMTQYILPLEVLGLLLTAALIGAVIIAMREPKP
jgi:NADH-quinone oxidoreductase subunit J